VADPEAYLGSLEPIGWRLGLERMARLTSLLGMPQHRFASIHVVGTNGKSSVTKAIAALLEAHGLSAGAYLSPHLHRWGERIELGGEPIGEAELASAVERTAEAAATVNRTLDEGDFVTQFEVATAAAFVAFAAARVEVAVIEAGLGGRLDGTNVIPSRITVLTSIGLDHTQWLGPSEAEIAAEKLAVLRDHTILVSGRLEPEILALARATAAARQARFVEAPGDPGAAYPERNLVLAEAAAEAFLGRLDEDAARSVASSLAMPGRLELIDGEPPIVLDAAHNPAGARALVEALPRLTGGRPVVGCVAVLADKDAAGIAAELVAACETVVCTEVPAAALAGSGRPGAESLPAASLAELVERAGGQAEALGPVEAALARARELAGDRDGVVLVTGSHYLLGLVEAQL
jgi:dihydrofolate synthase/folylpolyglutamate synthase